MNISLYKKSLTILAINIIILLFFGLTFLDYSFNRNTISRLIYPFSSTLIILEKKTPLETYGVSHVPDNERFNIYLIWYGDKLPEIYFKGLETLVYHHPKCDILIFSNELNEAVILPFKQKGYNNIYMVRFNLTKMVENNIGYDFVEKANKLLKGEKIDNLHVSRVHLSDFLRYFLVYTYGGLYLDTDSFVLKNMEHLTNTIGVTDNFSYHCSKKAFSGPKAKNFTCLSNGVFHFDKNHPFMKDAVINYEMYWRKSQGYAPAGATMLMELIENNFDKINFIPQREMLCFYHLHKTRNVVSENDTNLKNALDICYTIQLLGAGSSSNGVNNFENTFIGRIYQKYRIF